MPGNAPGKAAFFRLRAELRPASSPTVRPLPRPGWPSRRAALTPMALLSRTLCAALMGEQNMMMPSTPPSTGNTCPRMMSLALMVAAAAAETRPQVVASSSASAGALPAGLGVERGWRCGATLRRQRRVCGLLEQKHNNTRALGGCSGRPAPLVRDASRRVPRHAPPFCGKATRSRGGDRLSMPTAPAGVCKSAGARRASQALCSTAARARLVCRLVGDTCCVLQAAP